MSRKKTDKPVASISKEVPDKRSDFEKLIELRESFVKDLKDMKNPDNDSRLILQSKIIAIGQALDVLGYVDPDDNI